MSEGPYFDELEVGDVLDSAPAMTLTRGRAAVHQSILGSRLRLSLDEHLAGEVAGEALADPSFVWDVAIGQSTEVTRRVVANLFYRGLAFHRMPAIGDTLRTVTEVVGLRQNASRPSGLAALRITTRDQEDRTVLDFWRCAMLPLSSADVRTGHDCDLATVGEPADFSTIAEVVDGWRLERMPVARIGQDDSWDLEAGDVVTCAPELARLTLNLAHTHHDERRNPRGRLVYGGHAIGLALAQVTKVLPDLVTVAGWHGCEHTGPVREGDTLTSHITVESVEPIGGVHALHLRVRVRAHRVDETADVLDWRPIVLSR